MKLKLKATICGLIFCVCVSAQSPSVQITSINELNFNTRYLLENIEIDSVLTLQIPPVQYDTLIWNGNDGSSNTTVHAVKINGHDNDEVWGAIINDPDGNNKASKTFRIKYSYCCGNHTPRDCVASRSEAKNKPQCKDWDVLLH